MQRKTTFCFLLFLSVHFLSAQNNPTPASEEKVYEMFDVEKAPEFPGGETALLRYISEHLKYPVLARENNIQGTVVMQFVVMKDGSVGKSRILKDIGAGCGKESLRVVQSLPKWTPGEAHGQPVNVLFTLPIRFQLNDEVPAEAPASGPLLPDQMWKLVAETFEKFYAPKALAERSAPFSMQAVNDVKALEVLKTRLHVNLSSADTKGFKTLGEISDYFYKTQFAPVFYENANWKGLSTTFLSDRADFQANGLTKAGALKVLSGMQITLYTKKNFKGEKLEIDGRKGEVLVPDLSAVQAGGDQIKVSGKTRNWTENIKSIKIIQPTWLLGKQ